MPADTALSYQLALAEGDLYAALLAAMLNDVSAALGDDCASHPVVEEPDF